MKIEKVTLLLIVSAFIMASCGNKGKAKDDLADSGRTKRTEALIHNLDSIADKGFLVGQQDATLYGIGWEGDSARTDIKSVCSESPAVVGFEIGGIEMGSEANIYGISFDTIRRAVLAQYDCGGACLLSWHIKKVPSTAQIDRLCDFLISLEEPYGVRVPVILRPCSDGLNAGFWQTLRERFEDKEVVNTLLAYTVPKLSARSDASGDKSANLKDMMENIDILGIELFDLSKSADKDTMGVYSKQLDESLSSLEKMGKDYSKPVAIFATGAESVPYESWFTEILLPVLDKHYFSFILFGRNDNHHPGHFFVPFPGHPAVSDFTKFANSPRTIFLRETNGLYILRGDDVK